MYVARDKDGLLCARVRKYGLKILKIIVLTLIMFVLYLKIGSRKSSGRTKSHENLF